MIISKRRHERILDRLEAECSYQVGIAYSEGKIHGMREIAASIVEDARERAIAYERETLALEDDDDPRKLYLYGATHGLSFLAESLEAVMNEVERGE